jgi:hypothetical protein
MVVRVRLTLQRQSQTSDGQWRIQDSMVRKAARKRHFFDAAF